MRPRKTNRHLPPCVYPRHGAFWLVKRGKWTRLGATLSEALQEYGRLHSEPKGGLDKHIDDALAAHRHKIAPSTYKLYLRAAAKIKHSFAEFAPEQVKQRHVAQFRLALVGTPGMANQCLSVLRIVFGYLVEQQLIDDNPAIGITRLEQEPRDRLISREEFNQIREKAVPRLRCMMDLMYLTGQRLMDVVNIREADIGAEGVAFRQGKTGARLIVRWTPELRAAVDAARAVQGKVRALTLFRGRRGTPPKYKAVYVQWCAACTLAGVENAQARDLRAMSGTEADEQGMNPTKLLGHASELMTKRYLRGRRVPVVDGPSFGQVLDLPEKGHKN